MRRVKPSPKPGTSHRLLFVLLALYASGVAARYALCLLASQNPFIMPDEALYANIARSIASGTGITLRGQPLTYTNLLYPLLISPVYTFASPGSQFRLVQLINCLMMNLAVFPSFAIAKRFTPGAKAALGIAVLSILLPDMLLTTRIMTEAAVYPLFMLTVMLMFRRFEGKDKMSHAAITAVCAFLLAQAKAGMIALAAVFAGLLVIDCVKSRRRQDIQYAMTFAALTIALMLLAHIALSKLAGMDYGQPSIYQTQLQPPMLEHLKRTLPGILLYAFFIPVAFGIFPLLLPAANIGKYAAAQRSQITLALITLALVAAGACYMFFDTETIGNFYAGRIHIRYVFMFLPLFLAFLCSRELDDARPNGRLAASLGFLLAMTVTVSFGALLSARQYPVDAISLSWISWDDPDLNMKLLSQIAAITFASAMLWLLFRHGWGKRAKVLMACCMVLSVLSANAMGYDLNSYNNSKALSHDAAQAAEQLAGKTALLVGSDGIYFDNTLSVLDCAMKQAPDVMLLEDLCEKLGPYGALLPVVPPKYWTENPANAISATDEVVMNSSAFGRVVLATGTVTKATANGTYGIVSLPTGRRLFHSALAGLDYDGQPKANAALYIFDEALLGAGKVTVYLQVAASQASVLSVGCGTESASFNITPQAGWISQAFTVLNGATRLAVTIRTVSGAPRILTYKVGS